MLASRTNPLRVLGSAGLSALLDHLEVEDRLSAAMTVITRLSPMPRGYASPSTGILTPKNHNAIVSK